jgi:hypothetical protein
LSFSSAVMRVKWTVVAPNAFSLLVVGGGAPADLYPYGTGPHGRDFRRCQTPPRDRRLCPMRHPVKLSPEVMPGYGARRYENSSRLLRRSSRA